MFSRFPVRRRDPPARVPRAASFRAAASVSQTGAFEFTSPARVDAGAEPAGRHRLHDEGADVLLFAELGRVLPARGDLELHLLEVLRDVHAAEFGLRDVPLDPGEVNAPLIAMIGRSRPVRVFSQHFPRKRDLHRPSLIGIAGIVG
jgi:hypothetical protein